MWGQSMNNRTTNTTHLMLTSAMTYNALQQRERNKIKRATLTKDQIDKIDAQDREECKVIGTALGLILVLSLIVSWVTKEDFFDCLVAIGALSAIAAFLLWILWCISLWFL